MQRDERDDHLAWAGAVGVHGILPDEVAVLAASLVEVLAEAALSRCAASEASPVR